LTIGNRLVIRPSSTTSRVDSRFPPPDKRRLATVERDLATKKRPAGRALPGYAAAAAVDSVAFRRAVADQPLGALYVSPDIVPTPDPSRR